MGWQSSLRKAAVAVFAEDAYPLSYVPAASCEKDKCRTELTRDTSGSS